MLIYNIINIIRFRCHWLRFSHRMLLRIWHICHIVIFMFWNLKIRRSCFSAQSNDVKCLLCSDLVNISKKNCVYLSCWSWMSHTLEFPGRHISVGSEPFSKKYWQSWLIQGRQGGHWTSTDWISQQTVRTEQVFL